VRTLADVGSLGVRPASGIAAVAVSVLAAGVAVWPALADPAAPGPAPGPSTGPSATASPTPAIRAAEAPPAPGVIDRDGLYTVGTQIVPGVYTSAGPAEGTKCYWKRVGHGDAILENALTAQPQVVQIEPTDIAFKTRGCQPWQLTEGAAPPGQTPPWLAQIQLRHQLDVLNGLAAQSGNGQLPPY